VRETAAEAPRSGYPLAWPAGWKRTASPRKPPYKLTLEAALDELLRELRSLHARDVVITSNVPTRRDGLPRSGLSEPPDRGVAVYWSARDRRPMVMACDTWNTVRGNIRAIGLAIGALRAIERSGASQLLERAYTGFTALPSEAGASSWRAVLGFGPGPISILQLEEAYKKAARTAHPDVGGSHERMVEVNRAYADAQREVFQ